jgi:hypothetical protein
MSLRRLLLPLAFLTSFSALAAAPAAPAAATWSPAKTADGRLLVEFPGKPTADTQTHLAANGETLHLYSQRFSSQRFAFEASETELSAQAPTTGDEQGYIDSGVQMAREGMGLVVDADGQKPVTVSGLPGRDITGIANGARVHMRVVVGHHRIYMLTAAHDPGDAASNADAKRYFASMKVVDSEAAPK